MSAQATLPSVADLALVADLFDSLFGRSLDGVMLTLERGPILRANAAACRLLQMTEAEVCRGGRAGIMPASPALDAILAQRAHDGVIHGELTLRRGDGSLFPVEMTSTLSDSPGERYSITVFRDITERKRAVAEREEYFKFFKNSTDMMCIADPNGAFKKVNPATSQLLGYTEEELLSQPFLAFVHPDDREQTQSEMADQVKRGYSLDFINRYVCKDGSIRWLSWRAFVHAQEGLTYATARDITEFKKLQAQLQLADRMASLGTLAAGVAHEINNPLAFLMANVTFAIDELRVLCATADEVGTDARVAQRLEGVIEALDEAREGGQRVRRIVRDLKMFSHAENEQTANVDIEQVLESSLRMASNEIRFRARLVRDFGASHAVVANEARLGQVFVNLLINAAQSIPEGRAAENEIRVVSRVGKDGRVIVEVRDTGTGIRPDILGRIFDPFFTTKPPGVGTGLGLSICHGIVTGLGGEISVESVVGEGTTVRVVLPAAGSRIAVAGKVLDQGLRPCRILVVDDEPMMTTALRRMLQKASHDVVVANAARQALALITAGDRFDVILCDLMMPDVTGAELHAKLCAIAPDQASRMVFMTGGAFTAEARAFLSSVPNRRVDKPIEKAQLDRALREQLGQPA